MLSVKAIQGEDASYRLARLDSIHLSNTIKVKPLSVTFSF